MYDIVFSIAVHEEPMVVADQILNLLHWAPSCAVVIHINKNALFGKEDILMHLPAACSGSVYVTPEAVALEWAGGGLVYAHYLNYMHLCKEGISYRYLTFNASNFMLCKSGLNAYVSQYDIGFNKKALYSQAEQCWRPDIGEAWWHDGFMGKNFLKDTALFACAYELQSEIIHGYHEGAFMKREIADEFFAIFGHAYAVNLRSGYADEETWIPTILSFLSRRHGLSTAGSYVQFAWPAKVDDINRVRSANDNLFGLKQVTRVIDDPVRKLLRSMQLS